MKHGGGTSIVSRWRSLRGRTSFNQGLKAEDIAVRYLADVGAEIVARRLIESGVEIDIVARHDGFLVLVEVKSRPDADTALRAISRNQRRRIESVAPTIWNKLGSESCGMRFDLMAILPDETVLHYQDFWRVGE